MTDLFQGQTVDSIALAVGAVVVIVAVIKHADKIRRSK